MATRPATDLDLAVITRRRPLVKRGALTLTFDPTVVQWNGIDVGLSRVEAALLAKLVQRSRLSWDEVGRTLRMLGCCPGSRDVMVHRIRRKFAALGADNPIETVRGWGIRFRVERDLSGSTTFWIGASEDQAIAAR